MERLKSLRSSSYRHLSGSHAVDDNDNDDDDAAAADDDAHHLREDKVAQNDVVLKIDEAQQQQQQQRGKWTANSRTVSRSVERRARAASIELEKEQGKDPCLWQEECSSYDLLTTVLHDSSALPSHREQCTDAAGGNQLSKEMSARSSNSSRRFFQGGSGSTSSSSAGPAAAAALLTQAPLFTTEHLLRNFTENPTFSPAAGAWSRGIGFYGGFKASRFGRAVEDTKRNPNHATAAADDEMRSLTSRRSNSDDLSHKVISSFAAEEKCLKSSASNSPQHYYNRTKSRFSELPPCTYQRPEYSGSLGRGVGGGCSPCSGKLRSGQLKSGQQLKSSQLQSGLILPHTGMLGQIEEEECAAFEDEDLPDKPSPSCKWSYWVCLEWVLLLIILGALACSIQIPWLHKISFWELHLWKWVLLILMVFCGHLLSGWAVQLLVFGLEHNFLMRKLVLYFVYVLRQALQGCIWLALVLIVWHCMFNPRAKESAHRSLVYISKVLLCFVIAATLFVIKVFMVKVLSSQFHVVTYFERIRDSLFNQYVLETLSGPPAVEIQQILHDEQKLADEVADLKNAAAMAVPGLLLSLPDPMIPHSQMLKTQATLKRIKTSLLASTKELKPDSGICVQHLHKMNQQNVSAWNMKRLVDMVRHTGIRTLTHTIDNSSEAEESEVIDTEIRSEWQAKAAAKQIFKKVARQGLKFVDEEDLMRFMQAEETIRALVLFDGAMESGKITKQALKNWVVAVYRERRALALSLSDMDTAVKKLHRTVDVVLALTVLIVWLLILGISPMHLLVFVFSQMLLIAFLFGNVCKTLVEAIIFMFIMHPFDVGDRCVIDSVQYVVEEMNILTTVFLGEANAKVWIPNSVLANKLIQNFYRSPEMGDGFEFVVHASTPAEKIATLKENIGKYIASKPHHWNSKFSLVVVDLSEGGKMKLSLGLSHTMNYQDFGEKVARRSELMLELKRLFEELKIGYHLPPQEVHLRTLTDLNLPD